MAMISRKMQIIQMLEENEEDYFLQYALGLEYLSESNYSSAQKQFEKSIQLNSEYIPAYYQLGVLLYHMNNKEAALQILNKGLELSVKKQEQKNIAEFKSAIFNIENDLL